jgi:hypothetical protein
MATPRRDPEGRIEIPPIWIAIRKVLTGLEGTNLGPIPSVFGYKAGVRSWRRAMQNSREQRSRL